MIGYPCSLKCSTFAAPLLIALKDRATRRLDLVCGRIDFLLLVGAFRVTCWISAVASQGWKVGLLRNTEVVETGQGVTWWRWSISLGSKCNEFQNARDDQVLQKRQQKAVPMETS